MEEKDNEFENYKKTYGKIQAVVENQEQNFLVEVFASGWKAKHKGNYIFPVTNAHFTQMKDFRRQVGSCAAQLIEHYFTMRDDWFIQQRHSLDCLLKNVNKVIASYSTNAHARESAGKMSVPFHCDSCWEPFNLLVPITYNFDRPSRCPECEKQNTPLRVVSKEDRNKALHILGTIFLDVDKK